ncbi:MAG: ferritin [Acidimicrobiia bacterium]|nr:ferritin [Acidimicrobiia bacterium]
MPISTKLEAAFNDQINLELASSYAYLQMAAFLDEENLPGMSAWMRLQAEEERVHAMKFFDFVLDREGHIELEAIAAPGLSLTTARSAFEASLGHEQKVTAAINNLYALATDDRDFASYPLLNWFVEEQIEEEANVGLIVEQLKMIGDDRTALLMLDRELGARQPSAEGE